MQYNPPSPAQYNRNDQRRYHRLDMSANLEQGNGQFDDYHYGRGGGYPGHHRRRRNALNQSAMQMITSRIEEIKNSPSMEGCGKETIITIAVIIALIAGLAYLIVSHWKSITGLIEPFFEWFQ
jgi:hypothetical protein